MGLSFQFMGGAALSFHCPFLIAPPLLVAFTELCNPACKARLHPVKTVGLVALCALVGSAARGLFTLWLGLPLALAAALAALAMAAVVCRTKLYFPPAGAMAILAMLIPAGQVALFPLQVLAGFSALTAAALALFKGEVSQAAVSEDRAAPLAAK